MSPDPTGDGLIVDVPDQLSWARRTADAGLTTFAMVLWFLALRPLFLLGIWYLGWQVAYTHMVKLEGWNNPGYFAALGAVVAGISALLFVWGRYNALRFRRVERRELQRASTEAEVAARFGLAPEQIEQVRRSRDLRIERPRRTAVVVVCEDGTRFDAHHDPLGLRPKRAMRTPAARGGR